jgi:FkbM family methyltransferase
MILALPILRGPLRGTRWLLATRINFFLGTYEPEQTEAFVGAVRAGAVVYDVGAHYGYYSLLASRLAGTAGRVIALEPSPRNLRVLRKHMELNRAANITVLETALSDHQGEAQFDNRAGSGVGHLSPEGPLTVKLTTLDLLASRFPAPDVLKIDVEGAEEAVLTGGRETLARSRPVLFLSTHGPALAENCGRVLSALGYSLRELLPGELLASPRPVVK